MALINKLTAIAEAIRLKTGKTDTLTLDAMASEIAGIEAGGDAELIYETEFSIAEKVSSATKLATFSTGLTSANVSVGDVLLAVTKCVNDTDADTSYKHFKAGTEPLFVVTNGTIPVSNQFGCTWSDSGYSVYGVGPFRCTWAGAYAASIQLTARGDYGGFGVPAPGDYSFKLYRVSGNMLGLEGFVL